MTETSTHACEVQIHKFPDIKLSVEKKKKKNKKKMKKEKKKNRRLKLQPTSLISEFNTLITFHF